MQLTEYVIILSNRDCIKKKMREKLLRLFITYILLLCFTGCGVLKMPLNDAESESFKTGNDSNNLTNNANDIDVELNGQNTTITIEQPVIKVTTENGNYKTQKQLSEEMEAEKEEEIIYDDINKIYSKEASDKDKTVLVFAGDVCFYDGYANMGTFRDNGSDIRNCIDDDLMSEMNAADIFMLNNEFCYSDRGTPTEGKQYTLRSKPSNVSILHDMGADIVSLANNHTYDYGPDALIDTVDTLNEAKIPFVGAGKNLEEALKPVYFKINGKTISFVSGTQIERTASPDTKEATEDSPGVLRTLEPSKMIGVIETADANSDFTVVYVHWGSENTDLVEASQRELANKYVNAGANLIIGDHSHCLQGIDYIGNVPVFYSLGNYWFNSKTVDTGLAKITLDSDFNIVKNEFITAIQSGCKTKKAGSDNNKRILEYLQGISNHALIDTDSGEIVKSEKDMNTQNGQNTCPNKKVDTPVEAANANGETVVSETDESAVVGN